MDQQTNKHSTKIRCSGGWSLPPHPTTAVPSFCIPPWALDLTCRISSIWMMDEGSLDCDTSSKSPSFTFSRTKSRKPSREIWRMVSSCPWGAEKVRGESLQDLSPTSWHSGQHVCRAPRKSQVQASARLCGAVRVEDPAPTLQD